MPRQYNPQVEYVCAQCSNSFRDYVSNKRRYCSRQCVDDARSIRGRVDTQGYRVITVDGSRVYEHRHIWEQAHGPIPDGLQVHHRDGDKLNNDVANLELLTIVEHGLLHARRVDRGLTVCVQCGQSFAVRIQTKNLFCSSACHSVWMKGRPRPGRRMAV